MSKKSAKKSNCVFARASLLAGTALSLSLGAGMTGAWKRYQWVLTGAAVVLGITAVPQKAEAICGLVTSTIVCEGDSPNGYLELGLGGDDRDIFVLPGADVSSGILLPDFTAGNINVDVQAANGFNGPAMVTGVTPGIAVPDNHAFNLTSNGGDVFVETGIGTSVMGGFGNLDAFRIRTSGTGTITMNMSGDAYAPGAPGGGEAIDAQTDGSGTVNINLLAGTYTADQSDVVVVGSLSGPVNVDVATGVTLRGGNDLVDHGLWVRNSTTANVNFNGNIGEAGTPVAGSGIVVGAAPEDALSGTAGTVDVLLGTNSHIEATGNGVFVLATGPVNVTNIGADTILAGIDGIHIITPDTVDALNAGTIGSQAARVVDGISIASGANVTVSDFLEPQVVGGTIWASHNAIDIADGDEIDVSLANSTLNATNDAINIRDASGVGDTNVTLGSHDGITMLSAGHNGVDIMRTDLTGNVSVAVKEGSTVLANNGRAVSIETDDQAADKDNTVMVESAGLLQGKGTMGDPTAWVMTDGSATLHNQTGGVIQGASVLLSDRIVDVTSTNGEINVVNDGTMIGNMSLNAATGVTIDNNSSNTWSWSGPNIVMSGADINFNNNASGVANAGPSSTNTFISTGNSTISNAGVFNIFSAPTDMNSFDFTGVQLQSMVNNTGTMNVTGVAFFDANQNLEFNNAGGLLNMSNGLSNYGLATPATYLGGLGPYQNGIGDVTFVGGAGNFNGGQGSKVAIDAFLAAQNTSSADLLIVGDPGSGSGNTTGKTVLAVNDLNSGPGSYNPQGILVVDVEGSSPKGSFTLAGGPIDKGLFDYDLYRVGPAGGPVDWVLASSPNQRAFELPKLITGAQTLWYESSGVWLDRTADLRRTMGCAPAPVQTVNLAPLKLGPSDEAYVPGAPCIQQRMGVWARGFGGEFNRSDTDSTTLLGVKHTLNGDYDQSLWGIESGADVVIMRPNAGYGALFAGVMGGYVNSQMDFKGTHDKADMDGGMVGGYLTYLAGGWYNDLLLKADLLSVDYKTTYLGGKASPDIDSFGIRYDTGYRFNLGSGFFVDPQATIAWVDTNADNFNLFNSGVKFSNGDSVRGRLGGRLGYSTIWGGTIVEPFFTGSFWHEFEGDNKASISSAGYKLTFKDQLDDNWGELGGGVNFFTGANSSVFVKADALVGGDLDGFNVKGGGRLAW
jgi:hypothetical protein